MRTLFDIRRFAALKPKPFVSYTDQEAVEIMNYLPRAAARIDKAICSHLVWAKVCDAGDQRFIVRDVRILEERVDDEDHPNMVVTSERLQVQILEGWRTAIEVWTDEEVTEEVETVQ